MVGARRIARSPAVLVILAGPTLLAFFTGGYFDTPRLAAAMVAWALALGAAIGARHPLPSSRSGRVGIAGLALLTAWTAISFAWAPLSDPAAGALERLILYLGALIAATALLRNRAARTWSEVVLMAGALTVVGYGLAGRVLPGLVHQAASVSAAGRLEQPLTYWNAMGALAAIGLVLAARIAGTPARAAPVRAAAAASGIMFAVGLYLTFSRGALAAFALGAIALLALSPTVPQLRSLVVVVVIGAAAAAGASAFSGVRALDGSLASRERQGLGALAILVVLAGAAAAMQLWAARAESRGDASLARLPHPRHLALVAASLVVALFVGLVAITAADNGARQPAVGANPTRLGSLASNRYDYWKVALVDGFGKDPVQGIGAGGFDELWLRYRNTNERVRVAHSLYVETLAELGLVGFALLLACFGGIAGAARLSYLRRPDIVAGPIAALVIFAVHTAVDWDWEMPALTLVAVALAGFVIAAADKDDVVDTGLAADVTSRPELRPVQTSQASGNERQS